MAKPIDYSSIISSYEADELKLIEDSDVNNGEDTRLSFIKALRGSPLSLYFKGNETLAWIYGYDGLPFNIEIVIILVIPIILALMATLLSDCLFGIFSKSDDGTVSEIPLISVSLLQQTHEEIAHSMAKSSDIRSYAKNFIIKANDDYLNIGDYAKESKERRNAMHIFKSVPFWIKWFKKHKKNHVGP